MVRKRLLKRMTQTGKSNRKADKKRHARSPGRRVSASGKVYTERRRNRSDRGSRL